MNYQKITNKLISQSCCTYSKRYDQYPSNHPSHVIDSSGPKILGSDNKWYIDLVCGLGSNLTEIKNNFCKPSHYEPMVAQEIKKKFFFIQKMKFLKTGTAACECAIRFARGFTGKKAVIGTGYHGSGNVTISAEKPGTGTVDECYTKFDSITELIHHLCNSYKLDKNCDIGTVIVEPVQLDTSDSVKLQLMELRKVCTQFKVVLIFDEIITGCRVPNYCVSQWWNIFPDLICMGKGIGNGFPFAVVAGREDILETPGVFISNTHNGELSGLKSAYETLQFIDRLKLKKLWDRGGRFRTVVNKMLPSDKLQLVGYNTRGEWRGDQEYMTLFFEQMALRGVILGRGWFITMAHDVKTLHEVLNAVEGSLIAIKKGCVRRGSLPVPIFCRNK